MYKGKANAAETERIRSSYGEVSFPTAVMLDLVKDYVGSGRNVTADNFFGSREGAEELMKRKLTAVFTVRKQRREIPKEIVDPRGKELHSSHFYFSDNCLLVTYKAKPSRMVLALSTLHMKPLVAIEEPKKPQIILSYNKTKGMFSSRHKARLAK